MSRALCRCCGRRKTLDQFDGGDVQRPCDDCSGMRWLAAPRDPQQLFARLAAARFTANPAPTPIRALLRAADIELTGPAELRAVVDYLAWLGFTPDRHGFYCFPACVSGNRLYTEPIQTQRPGGQDDEHSTQNH